MRTVTVFVFTTYEEGGEPVKVIADPALAILRKQEYFNAGLDFWCIEVPYEDDKIKPIEMKKFGSSGTNFTLLEW